MYGKIKEYLQRELADIKAAGLYKTERVIASPQRAEIEVAGRSGLNFCANNYLGLSDDERLIEAAKRAMDERGFGMSSVRFICGCQDIHNIIIEHKWRTVDELKMLWIIITNNSRIRTLNCRKKFFL